MYEVQVQSSFIVQKEGEPFQYCEDHYAISDKKERFAIADGATMSFFSRIWAKALTNNFVSAPQSSFIEKSQEEWRLFMEKFIENSKDFYALKRYHNGDIAAATFVGLELDLHKGKWQAQAIGDSFLFFISNGKQMVSLPEIRKGAAFHFDNSPDYLASDGDHKGNIKILEKQNLKTGTFYLMTDALAKWFLQKIDERLPLLENLSEEKAFQDLVARERKQYRLQDDDTTLLIIKVKEVEEKMEISKKGGKSSVSSKKGSKDFKKKKKRYETSHPN